MKAVLKHAIRILFVWLCLVWFYFLLIASMPDIVRITSSGVSVLLI
jgi:hypothetical protein